VPKSAVEASLGRRTTVDAVRNAADLTRRTGPVALLRFDRDRPRPERCKVPCFDAEEVGQEVPGVECDEEREGEELGKAQLRDGVVVRLLEHAKEDGGGLCTSSITSKLVSRLESGRTHDRGGCTEPIRRQDDDANLDDRLGRPFERTGHLLRHDAQPVEVAEADDQVDGRGESEPDAGCEDMRPDTSVSRRPESQTGPSQDSPPHSQSTKRRNWRS